MDTQTKMTIVVVLIVLCSSCCMFYLVKPGRAPKIADALQDPEVLAAKEEVKRAREETQKAYEEAYRIGTNRWECVSDMPMPVRINRKGEAECMSTDGKNCLMDCDKWIKEPPSNIVPFVCNVNSYKDPEHWCARTKELLE